MRVTHTHRGHCQVCLRVHAIDVNTGRLATHGYTVAHGYFAGECPGTGTLSLHVERLITDDIIARYRADALALKAKAMRYEARTDHPAEAWSGDYERVEEKTPRGHSYMTTRRKMIPFKEAKPVYQDEAIIDACRDLRRTADHYESNANQMEHWAAEIFDKQRPAYRVEEFDNGSWKVGDTVRIGGKKGFDATIEAIEERPYRTRGFSRQHNTTNVPHARITRPAIAERKDKSGYVLQKAEAPHTYWEPLRNIKRPKVALVEALREAGLID